MWVKVLYDTTIHLFFSSKNPLPRHRWSSHFNCKLIYLQSLWHRKFEIMWCGGQSRTIKMNDNGNFINYCDATSWSFHALAGISFFTSNFAEFSHYTIKYFLIIKKNCPQASLWHCISPFKLPISIDYKVWTFSHTSAE